MVGEQGLALTAAQAQHIALARLVLADPRVVVLDEATAEAGSAHAAELRPRRPQPPPAARRWSSRTGSRRLRPPTRSR